MFGRTLGPSNLNGRSHNQNHQVSITIGKPFKGGVIGGVAPVQGDYGAVAINSTTGAGGNGGDVAPLETLASFGRTVLAAVGGDNKVIASPFTIGKVVPAALA